METQFNIAVQNARAGQLQTPSVHYGGSQIDYFAYQLATHIYALKILSKGMKMNGVKLKDIKTYYGLKGKSAAACLSEFETIVLNYKARFQNN